jgi:hypothetical protein
MSDERVIRCKTHADYLRLPMRDIHNATKIIVAGCVVKNRNGPVGGRE